MKKILYEPGKKFCSRHKKGLCASVSNPQNESNFCPDKRSADGLTHQCKSCYRKYSEIHSSEKKIYLREYYKKNKEKHNEVSRLWYEENKEKFKKYAKARYDSDRKKYINDAQRWCEINRGKSNALKKNYKLAKIKAVPKWITKDHFEQIEYIYKIAYLKTVETGIVHEVDHIIPLRGKNVCGLHVPWNLQVLTKSQNSTKSNKVLTGVA